MESGAFKEWLKRWQARLERQEQTNDDSKQLMKQANPVVIPRNHQVEKALQAANEQDDFTPLQRLLAVLQAPYDYHSLNQEFMTPPEPSNHPYPDLIADMIFSSGTEQLRKSWFNLA